MSKLDSVWETHDFVIRMLTKNESEYNHLLSEIPLRVEMYEKGESSKTDLLNFIIKSEKLCKSLLALYHKHLLTIREICIMIEEEDIPEEREVTAEVIDDLRSTSLELIEAVRESEKILDFLKEEHQL